MTTIPSSPSSLGRRLVVCLDGTWNSTTNESEREDHSKVFRPTNTLKVCRAVLPDADRQQLVYYDVGVGSLAQYSGFANKLLHTADRFLGGAWGAGFEGNVEDALHFLMLNREPNDDVFLFGFSRGAATARAVTRFLEWSGGLLPKKDAYYFPFFFRAYVESHGDLDAKRKLLDEINERHAKTARPPIAFEPVRVSFLGVWDTVAALGSRFRSRGKETSEAGRTFHAGKAPATCVVHARQALAVDEKRFDFRPEVWTETRDNQKMQQRWFPGVHSNIGGGLKTDGLANIALQWILDGAKEEGLKLDDTFLAHYEPHPEAEIYESWTTKFKMLETVLLRRGKGRRPISGANADLHDSVIEKMRIDAKYRPDNAIEFLATQANVAKYGAIPADVQQEMAKVRAKRGAS
ncbi:MAG TPA: DUF2235 domain-containing protein [Thermoanaerobaculia bacterium]|nr:DUF2235 domain-containing protein [Thermoanaerobaculia bacterium]